MEARSNQNVVVKALVEIRLAIIVQIMKPRDLIASVSIDHAIDNLQPQRLIEPARKTSPLDLRKITINSLRDPDIPVPGRTSQALPVGEISMNKITKDRYLPTGTELAHSAQLYDITGDKMELLLDFPTPGEPHYAQAIPADQIKAKSKKIYSLDENKHEYAANREDALKLSEKAMKCMFT